VPAPQRHPLSVFARAAHILAHFQAPVSLAALTLAAKEAFPVKAVLVAVGVAGSGASVAARLPGVAGLAAEVGSEFVGSCKRRFFV
jgi:hypothetical protein